MTIHSKLSQDPMGMAEYWKALAKTPMVGIGMAEHWKALAKTPMVGIGMAEHWKALAKTLWLVWVWLNTGKH